MIKSASKNSQGENISELPKFYRGYYIFGTRIKEGILFKAQALNEDVYILATVNKRRTVLTELFYNCMEEDKITWRSDLQKQSQKLMTLGNLKISEVPFLFPDGKWKFVYAFSYSFQSYSCEIEDKATILGWNTFRSKLNIQKPKMYDYGF